MDRLDTRNKKAIVFIKLIQADPSHHGFSLLLLNPINDSLSFISCGLGDLFHLSQGVKEPRTLKLDNPKLGLDAHADFAETTDNWNSGDTLIFHSLDIPADAPAAYSELTLAIVESNLFSSQRAAEAILKKVASSPAFSPQKNPKVLFALQRIS